MTHPNLRSVIRNAEQQLAEKGIETARLDAELLLAFALGVERMALVTHQADIPQSALQSFQTYIVRRLSFEPVAYITGVQDFWSLTFKVNPNVLIPRPDTETLVETVLKRRPTTGKPTILDLGTGSGCILLSLLSEIKDAEGIGVDVSDGALRTARENAIVNKLDDRSEFQLSNWFSSVKRPEAGFDIIVSNPPYIRQDEMPELMPDVRDFEPHGALEGGADGLAPYRLLADSAGAFLAPDALLAVETGVGQTSDVANFFAENGLQDIEIHKDLNGIDRVVSAKNA